jgi:hypothetical protein
VSAITEEQRRFILLFITDGERDLFRTCSQLAIRPSVAQSWFREQGFQKTLKQAQAMKLATMGYDALFVMEDILAIAHSDIAKVQVVQGEGLDSIPRHVRVAVKTVEFGIGVKADGEVFTYPKKIVMHDKAWALQKVAEWHDVAAMVRNGGVQPDDGPKRLAGLVVRPPITKDEADGEELLK